MIDKQKKQGKQEPIRVMFVCMGNICRSPTAHGVFRQMVAKASHSDAICIESSGTHAYHIGQPPDSRAQEVARGCGIDLSDLRAQKINKEDFRRFDYIVAMDGNNISVLKALCPPLYQNRIHLLLDFAKTIDKKEVPDPYYGGADGFERVLDLIEHGAQGLLQTIIHRHF